MDTIEASLQDYGRRLTDHDGLLTKDRKDIDMLQKILESQQENNKFTAEIAGYAKETLAVIRPLMKVVRFGAVLAKYVSYIAIAFTASWHATKYIMVKIGVWHL